MPAIKPTERIRELAAFCRKSAEHSGRNNPLKYVLTQGSIPARLVLILGTALTIWSLWPVFNWVAIPVAGLIMLAAGRVIRAK